jgi:hypothetical protein
MNPNANPGKAVEGKVCHLSLHQGGCDCYKSRGFVFNIQRTPYQEFIDGAQPILNCIPSCCPNLVAIIPVAFYSKVLS